MADRLLNDDAAWADYFITRVGLLIFCSILLLSAFKIHPLFVQQDTALMLDARLASLAALIEAVDSTDIQGAHYYRLDTADDISFSISSMYVAAFSASGQRAQPLMTRVYPPNSIWKNRSELMKAIASGCQGRTGNGNNTLRSNDLAYINAMFRQVEAELATEPFIPDKMQPLIVEKVILNYQTPQGIQSRGVTIVYQ